MSHEDFKERTPEERIAWCREVLGPKAHGKSDEDIAEYLREADDLARVIVEMYRDEKVRAALMAATDKPSSKNRP